MRGYQGPQGRANTAELCMLLSTFLTCGRDAAATVMLNGGLLEQLLEVFMYDKAPQTGEVSLLGNQLASMGHCQ